MNEQQLEKLNIAMKQKKKLERVLSDLKHYNNDFHEYADNSSRKNEWWAKARKLFSSLYFEFNEEGDVSVEPNTVYGRIIWSPSELGETDEMKLEIAKSRARILDFMTEETERLLKLAESKLHHPTSIKRGD
jgi:hypothetical protein